MKRIFSVALAAALVWLPVPAAHGVGTSASSAVLMDAGSGRVLYQSNAHEPRLIASITKLMTALVALESGHALDEVVTIDPAWTGVEGSSIYLKAGEQVTLETLLYGMLLRSGNDAATAVAGFCGGTVESFVVQMNEKAAQLGMEDSAFANPSGLNEEGHHSSAWDMALLARACLENETLSKIVATKSIALGGRIFTNHNKLLWRYQGCIGMKTGFTEKAGRTLVSAAERDGLTLVCVTLNDPSDWADHAALFDYGFAEFESRSLLCAGETLCRLPVSGGLISFCPAVVEEDFSLCLAPGEEVRRELVMNRASLTAPVRQGTPLGEVVYYQEQTVVGRAPLTAGRSIEDVQVAPLGLWESLKGRLQELSCL
ncbi:MAG: D-alanyl-D-alanine carboxypeptidase [Lawsonibacter sp.]|nr:D-alanyl-D-alanine carboxypeptidase [Lawsonibacter sp.]